MPLRCLNSHDGKSLLAFDLTPAEWDRLRADNLKELERHRTVSAKITLRAVWSKFDDGLAENEYFAKVAADYH